MGRKQRRKEKRKQLAMTFVLVALMILSMLGVIIGSIDSGSGPGGVDLEFRGQKFQVTGNYYVTELNGKEKLFFFHPIDVLSVEVPVEAMTSLRGTAVVVTTFNPNSSDIEAIEVARFQMNTNLESTVYSAVTETSEEYTFPVVNCINASPELPILELVSTNTSSGITYDNGCITVSGRGIDIVKNVERLIYGMLGVME